MSGGSESTFSQRRYTDGQSCMKICLTSVIILKIRIKTTVRFQLTPVRIAIIEWTRTGVAEDTEKGTLTHLCLECKLVQPPRKTVWKFLTILRIKTSYNSAILLLGIYPKTMKTLIQKIHEHLCVHGSIIYNNYKKEAT